MGAKYTQAQNKATQKYVKNTFDTISVRVPKGEKEVIGKHAVAFGDGSMNAFINRAIKEAMKRDIIKG